MKKLLALILACALVLTAGIMLVGCQPELGTVRLGLHGNFGSSASYAAKEAGYWTEEGITVDITNTNGPSVVQGLKAGTLDIGMLGNGVSWNYFTADSAITMLTIDNLTDDDRLIAQKNSTLTTASTVEQIATALKGKSVALDLAKTPATFFKSLINKCNTGKAVADKIWFQDLTANYPAEVGLVDSNKITVVNTENANITAAMSGTNAPDFCVAFAPISSKLIKDGFKEVAKYSTHLPDLLTPTNYAVNTQFLKDHPEEVQAFMNGLVRGMNLRTTDMNLVVAYTANQLRMEASDFVTGIAYWPSSEDLAEWFATTTSDGYKYLTNIRNSHLGNNELTDANAKSVTAISDFTYLLKACEKLAK